MTLTYNLLVLNILKDNTLVLLPDDIHISTPYVPHGYMHVARCATNYIATFAYQLGWPVMPLPVAVCIVIFNPDMLP